VTRTTTSVVFGPDTVVRQSGPQASEAGGHLLPCQGWSATTSDL